MINQKIIYSLEEVEIHSDFFGNKSLNTNRLKKLATN